MRRVRLALHPTQEHAVQPQTCPHCGQPLLWDLTPRQTEALLMIAQGLTNDEIAERLVIATGTVKTHLTAVYAALHVRGRIDAIRRAQQLGIVELEEVEER